LVILLRTKRRYIKFSAESSILRSNITFLSLREDEGKADVTSKVILMLQTSEAASLGAAILAGVARGRFKRV